MAKSNLGLRDLQSLSRNPHAEVPELLVCASDAKNAAFPFCASLCPVWIQPRECGCSLRRFVDYVALPESIFTSKEPTRNWKAGYGVQDGSSVAESTIKRGWQGKRMQLCNRPASTQGAVSCEGSVRGGRSESIWLLRRVDSISSVSRNHPTGSSSLSFVVPNGP